MVFKIESKRFVNGDVCFFCGVFDHIGSGMLQVEWFVGLGKVNLGIFSKESKIGKFGCGF